MKIHLIGIDGLETSIIDHYIKDLPNFRRIREKGSLLKANSVYPADSVPAWLTIYTGLNPSVHGIIRGKDYVESVEDFEKRNNFQLAGSTFWDKLGKDGMKCLILNPYLAYPVWPVNGIMIAGPAFVEGSTDTYPKNLPCDARVYGGYKPIGRMSQLEANMEDAISDTEALWKEYELHNASGDFNLSFVLFTTLDRIQHYTWRFYDKQDPLYEENAVLSAFIPRMLKFFDEKLGKLMDQMGEDDHLVMISDHGFGPRPYKLINFNELLRQKGFLKLKEGASNMDVKFKQKLRNVTIKTLSKLKILDLVSLVLRNFSYFKKYKKSDFIIDKVNSKCYIDENFSGKKPYCGFNFGEQVKNSSAEVKAAVLEEIRELMMNTPEIPTPRWIKFNYEVYEGKYHDRYPDICMELPKEYGVEFDLFNDIITESVTHYKISGGHYDAGTFGYYSRNGNKPDIKSLDNFHNFILSLAGR
ncbi:MAG: alkaline phosphatase family protein [Bacteroidetes bacterium]|nr:alkaline phosphatase family protein [Bacteroidota bacterium]